MSSGRERRARPESRRAAACATARPAPAAPAVLNLVENRSHAARPDDRGAARARSRPPRSAARRRRTSSASPARRARASRRCCRALVRGVARRAGARSRCSPSTRRRSARAARCSATARGSTSDPADRGVFIRSMAAGGRLGGLAPATRAAAQALAAAFDVVVIETVGVGQSETEVAEVGRHRRGRSCSPAPATRCSSSRRGSWRSPTCSSSRRPTSATSRCARGATCTPRCARSATARHAGRRGLVASRPRRASTSWSTRSTPTATRLDLPARAHRTRAALGALADFVAEHGERGLRALGGRRAAERFLAEQPPDADEPALVAALEARAAG